MKNNFTAYLSKKYGLIKFNEKNDIVEKQIDELFLNNQREKYKKLYS